MGLSETYDHIKKAGGKMSLEELYSKSYFSRQSVKTALRKLNWRQEIFFYKDLDGTEMVALRDEREVVEWPSKQKVEAEKKEKN
jgi:hypothetical protein